MMHLTKKLISWASILDPQTREQAQRTASMLFIMADAADLVAVRHMLRQIVNVKGE